MSNLNELVSQLLEGYNEGLYTLSETYWRLILLVDKADQVDALIEHLPAEFAAAWTAWAQATCSSDKEEYILLGRGPVNELEKGAINAFRLWLARHPDLTGGN